MELIVDLMRLYHSEEGLKQLNQNQFQKVVKFFK